ncbi:hypothetical protein N752_05215 [Desulforamulus aquiferis]|nr:hypothetical protein [Desulforamulus aquiferis]RYD06293.1 hypothetical protein N752_05215 [Desulforamulus aquiferis]
METASNLAVMLSSVYKQLDTIETGVLDVDAGVVKGGMMKDQVDQINSIITQINDLTNSIKKIYVVGQQPNDLLDKRDALLEQLSHYGPVQVTDGFNNGKPNGELTLAFYGTEVLNSSSGVCLNDLELEVNAGGEIIVNSTSSGEIVNLSEKLDNQEFSGSLVGLVNARQKLIDEQDKLNTLAEAIRDEMNTILSASGTGYETFLYTGNLENGDFKVNPDLFKNLINLTEP